MKNKKISTLLNGLQKVHQQLQVSQNAPTQQSTIKITYQSPQGPISITAIQIKKLQSIFPSINLQQVSKDLQQYMSLPSQILGKRSSKIVISKSSQFLLKIIQQDDLHEINKMLNELLNRFQNNKINCLVNIYYIFVLEHTISNVKLLDRYIVMPNIRANFDKCFKMFDIKGHLDARVIRNEDFVDFKFGKDQNFVQSKELEILKQFTTVDVRVKIIQEIEENINFLMKYGILDYSLLFSFEQNHQQQVSHSLEHTCRWIRINNITIFKWIIIDYFQIFNQKKKLQNKFKSLFFKSVSSVQPQIYSKRLVDFLKKYLLS